jgi:hypothetical protein
VGNLVCPALFDLGERSKVVIFSVADGEDKPLKYPHMFSAAGVVIFNKIDLLPHLDFQLTRQLRTCGGSITGQSYCRCPHGQAKEWALGTIGCSAKLRLHDKRPSPDQSLVVQPHEV